MKSRPAKISVSRSQGLLVIDWENGHHSEYPLAGLRSACPCAECKGGHETMGGPGDPGMLLIPDDVGPAHEIEAVEPVGNYALQILWKDGHRYGIYSWDYLWQLCPCGDHPGAGAGNG